MDEAKEALLKVLSQHYSKPEAEALADALEAFIAVRSGRQRIQPNPEPNHPPPLQSGPHMSQAADITPAEPVDKPEQYEVEPEAEPVADDTVHEEEHEEEHDTGEDFVEEPEPEAAHADPPVSHKRKKGRKSK